MRPIEIAEVLETEFEPLLVTPQSSSYPSGTAAAIQCIALFVNEDELTELKKADNLGKVYPFSYKLRVVGGVHYPMDITKGIEIGTHIYNGYKERQKNIQKKKTLRRIFLVGIVVGVIALAYRPK